MELISLEQIEAVIDLPISVYALLNNAGFNEETHYFKVFNYKNLKQSYIRTEISYNKDELKEYLIEEYAKMVGSCFHGYSKEDLLVTALPNIKCIIKWLKANKLYVTIKPVNWFRAYSDTAKVTPFDAGVIRCTRFKVDSALITDEGVIVHEDHGFRSIHTPLTALNEDDWVKYAIQEVLELYLRDYELKFK